MKSWKTSLGGALASLGYWASLQPDPWWLHRVGEPLTIIGLAFIGVYARDNNVPSAAVPKAAEAAAKIEADMPPPFAK
jgi:hypothetical protein